MFACDGIGMWQPREKMMCAHKVLCTVCFFQHMRARGLITCVYTTRMQKIFINVEKYTNLVCSTQLGGGDGGGGVARGLHSTCECSVCGMSVANEFWAPFFFYLPAVCLLRHSARYSSRIQFWVRLHNVVLVGTMMLRALAGGKSVCFTFCRLVSHDRSALVYVRSGMHTLYANMQIRFFLHIHTIHRDHNSCTISESL